MRRSIKYAALLAASAFILASCDDPISPDDGVTLDKTTLELQVNARANLTATVESAQAVSWSSSNEAVATVSATGEVVGLAAGTATITAKAGKASASCVVTVKQGGQQSQGGGTTVSAITLNKTTLELAINARETLTATIEPANAAVKIVSWSSSNEKIAKVSGTGEVFGVATGTATITAKVGGVSATCAVTVTQEEKPLGPIDVKISGTINHTNHTKGQSGTVEFNRFPASVDEFKQVRELIGGEPHGAVALQLMAMEMYRRDRKMGEEAIRLANVMSNVNSITGRLKELFGGDAYYNRPYQTAAFLKGAEPGNGYNPTKPYTIEVVVDPALTYQNSSIFQSTILTLRISCKGRSTGFEQVSVLKTKKPGEPGEKGKFFIVQSSPGMVSQVAPISFEHEFKGLD